MIVVHYLNIAAELFVTTVKSSQLAAEAQCFDATPLRHLAECQGTILSAEQSCAWLN